MVPVALNNALTSGWRSRAINLDGFRAGRPQRAGGMTVVPLFGRDNGGDRFGAPGTSMRVSKVAGYGNLELENPSARGVLIVPLHIGFIQYGAQNHATCRAAFVGAGQTLMLRDACCVQASQGGYLEGRDQWFFILPLELREKALSLRGEANYAKLWEEIADVCAGHGLPRRGHLEQLVGGLRARLIQYAYRFEALPGQTGALFLVGDRLVGVEIAPTARYFADVWPALVCFCYGAAAMRAGDDTERDAPEPLPGTRGAGVDGLRTALAEARRRVEDEVAAIIAGTRKQRFRTSVEERYLDLTLATAVGRDFTGQVVHDGDELVYASLAAKRARVPA